MAVKGLIILKCSLSAEIQSYTYHKLWPSYDTITAILRHNYGHTTIQLWRCYISYYSNHTYICTTGQLLLHYAVITLHYINFALTCTVSEVFHY